MTSTLTPAGKPAVRAFGEAQLQTDGDLLLVAFGGDGTLWSLETSGLLRHWTKAGEPLEARALSDLETEWAFSKDARFAISGSKDLSLWDALTGQVITTLDQDSWVTALTFSSDPAIVASGHDDGSIRVWSLPTHSAIHSFRHHKKQISALAIHADGKILAAASEDRTISLWNIETGKHLGTLSGHTDRIPALAWHPAQHILVSAGWDTTARVWDALNGKPLILLNNHATQVTAVAISPDGKRLASADSGQHVFVWDFAAYKVLQNIAGPTVEVRSLAFSPDSATVAATGDRVIHLWNAATGQPLSGAVQRSKVKPTVSVSADGKLLASNGGGQAVKVWNIASRQLLHTLTDVGEIHQVAFSPSGSLLAAACGPHGETFTHVRVWDALTGKVVHDLDGPEGPLAILAFSPDGTTIAAGGYTSMAVWFWSAKTGEPLLIIPDPLQDCAPQALAFHPQGKLFAAVGVDWLATGGSTGALSLWDLKGRVEVDSLIDGSTCVAFYPNGKSLAAGTLDRSIGIYDAASLDLQAELLGHDGGINCLAISPDGTTLASGSDDQTVRLWNEEGDEIALYEVDSKVTSLTFSPDGKSLFAAHANTTCSQWAI